MKEVGESENSLEYMKEYVGNNVWQKKANWAESEQLWEESFNMTLDFWGSWNRSKY